RAGLVIDLQLYFPSFGDLVRSTALIVETTADPRCGFWAELAGDKRSRDRIAVLLTKHLDIRDRGCPRFHTHLRARIVREGRRAEGCITNISRSGAFVKVESLPPPASIVDLEMTIPGAPGRETALGCVVHVAESRGLGDKAKPGRITPDLLRRRQPFGDQWGGQVHIDKMGSAEEQRANPERKSAQAREACCQGRIDPGAVGVDDQPARRDRELLGDA